MVVTSCPAGFSKSRNFFRETKMQQIQWPNFRGVTGQLGTMRMVRKSKKESGVEKRVPSIVGKGYNRPKSVDAVTLALQHQMSNLSLSTNGIKISKRPVSSTPTLSSTKSRGNSSKSGGAFNVGDEFGSIASSSSLSNILETPSNESNYSAETNSESDNSQGVSKRIVGQSYPKFNINTHNATKMLSDRENGTDKKEACGFLRCVMSELERKERAEETAKRKARRNATFTKEQTRQIDRENQILLNKLLRVEKNSKRTLTLAVPGISSNRKKEMEKESRRIRRDNARLYMKIKFARPSDHLVRASELG
ncbi:uncharacterized protein LOC119112749 [Pollicipes pollicipes]|uniref:uncharacterized protein LOC119112749 n=1 Tax=Pollicipes pollicipes TaxID=41117 RepID=UPI001884E394|nr:uncharacterized protein LOC119112749 [Pollicipes pollicipes]